MIPKDSSLVFDPYLSTLASLRGPMSFLIRPFRRFPVQSSVSYNTGPFQGQGTVWNLSYAG